MEIFNIICIFCYLFSNDKTNIQLNDINKMNGDHANDKGEEGIYNVLR